MKADKKIALITGAGQGIGRAVAGEFLERDIHVAGIDVQVSKEHDRLKMIKADVRESGQMKRVVEKIA